MQWRGFCVGEGRITIQLSTLPVVEIEFWGREVSLSLTVHWKEVTLKFAYMLRPQLMLHASSKPSHSHARGRRFKLNGDRFPFQAPFTYSESIWISIDGLC